MAHAGHSADFVGFLFAFGFERRPHRLGAQLVSDVPAVIDLPQC